MENHSAYLAGILDGEGTVTLHLGKRGYSRRVSIFNTDAGIISAVREGLNELGIAYRVQVRAATGLGSKPITAFHIYGKSNIEKVAALPLRSEKRGAIDKLLSTYKREVTWTREHMHSISAVDEETRTGVCAVCGLVKVHRGGTEGRWKCAEAAKAHYAPTS